MDCISKKTQYHARQISSQDFGQGSLRDLQNINSYCYPSLAHRTWRYDSVAEETKQFSHRYWGNWIKNDLVPCFWEVAFKKLKNSQERGAITYHTQMWYLWSVKITGFQVIFDGAIVVLLSWEISVLCNWTKDSFKERKAMSDTLNTANHLGLERS